MPDSLRTTADQFDSTEEPLAFTLTPPDPPPAAEIVRIASVAGRLPPGEESGCQDAFATRFANAQAAIDRKDFAAAAQIVAPELLPADAPLDVQVEWADTLAKAQQTEQSDAMFEALLLRFPGARKLHFTYGKRLHARGLAIRAAQVFETSDPFPEGTNQHKIVHRALRLRDILQARAGRRITWNEDCRLLALKHAILTYAGRNVRELAPDRIGRLSLITGGLGPGGAERQLARTAAELELSRQRDGRVGSVAIERPIEVLVRSHSGERQRDFYLGELQAAKVEVNEIDPMPPQATRTFGIKDEDLAILLDYLPNKVNFGVRRLVAHFRETGPDVVSLWQDGACLFAGLAAIIAGVPKIQLVIRGLPPVIRRHLFQPEYEVMYRAMAEVPGVEFISNSKAAASAYAEWLDVPIERFAILYNGVQKMPCNPTEALEQRWQEFVVRTPDATHTVGGVFRFDTDKRPTTWIRFAARYAKKHPDARFVVVGDGRLFDEAVALAADKGIADRILFVGRSNDVGFWMKKMDVLVLMSSFEGLPNVLIEAQYLGVPVVSTPAGGASECFIEGVTGHILGCADKTDLDEACQKVRSLLGRAQDPAIFEPVTRDFLEPNFSVSGMIENFVNLTCGLPATAQGQQV